MTHEVDRRRIPLFRFESPVRALVEVDHNIGSENIPKESYYNVSYTYKCVPNGNS